MRSSAPGSSSPGVKARGVNDILIARVDGLKGFPEAITTVFPQTLVQTCIVHLIRNSLTFVTWKDRKAIMPSIKAIYRAENADMALVRLEEFEAESDRSGGDVRHAYGAADGCCFGLAFLRLTGDEVAFLVPVER